MTDEEWANATPDQRATYIRDQNEAWTREFGTRTDQNYHEAAVAYDRDPSCWPDQPEPEPEQEQDEIDATETEAANE